MNHPVKGEKSLALMQRSLLGKQEESNATMHSTTTSPAATSSSNNVTAASAAPATIAGSNNHNNTSNANPLQHGQENPTFPPILSTSNNNAAAVSGQTSNPASSSSTTISNTVTAVRSKGKDIAQLQRLSPDKVSILQNSQTSQLPSQQTLQPQQTLQQQSQLQPQSLSQPQPISAPNTDALPQGTNINTSTTTKPTIMKSKGKDFASMMSRAPPSVHAIIDLNRQNAARKAAGLPPILADGSNVISGGSDVSLTAGTSLSLLQPQPLSQPKQLQQPLQPQQQSLQLQPPQHSLQDSNQSMKSNVPTFPTNNQNQATIPKPQPPPTHTLPEIKVVTKPKPTPKPTKVEGFMNASLSLSHTTGGTAVTHANNPSRQQSLAIRVKLSNILKSMDPSGLFSLEADAEEKLISLANDFANALVKKSTKIANHRHLLDDVNMDGMAEDGLFHGHGNKRKKRKCVEVDDVAFVLKKNYGMTIPGLPSCIGSNNKRGLLSSISNSAEGVSLATARVVGSAAAVHHPKKDDVMEGGNRGDVGTNPKVSVERSVDVSTVDGGGK